MSKKKLPEQAYLAMESLKDQMLVASVSIENDMKVDRESLANAHERMKDCEPWPSMIIREIRLSCEDVTVETIDAAWLEERFG